MHEQPVSAKKGARRRGKSLERGPRGDKEESTSRAFAVVGLDSDSSVVRSFVHSYAAGADGFFCRAIRRRSELGVGRKCRTAFRPFRFVL